MHELFKESDNYRYFFRCQSVSITLQPGREAGAAAADVLDAVDAEGSDGVVADGAGGGVADPAGCAEPLGDRLVDGPCGVKELPKS